MKQNLKSLGLILISMLSLSACSIVEPGERGVSVSFGHASVEPLVPGLYFWAPIFRGIKILNVQIQKTEIDAAAATRDLQNTQTHVALNWHVAPADVVRIYTEVGDADDLVARLITPTFNEVLKQASAKMTAEEVLTKRAALKSEIDTEMVSRLKKYGVFVDEVSIVNVSFGKEFTEAIEAKQVAEQKAKQAHYEALEKEQEAIGAVNTAKGQAEAQRLVKASIDKDIIALKWIEKWNGVLPSYMAGGNSPTPIISLHGDK